MPASIATSESSATAARDQQAVAAVLRGETLSYRELVERYQRQVYAVAWSRLGNAALAEDAAQEAFIRAYRSLPLLGNGAKFSAWVTAIARNTAINLGLKRRRELTMHQRWALEQPTSEPPAAAAEEACPPELLRQTLAELPDEYRESLVLFYLEGKRGAEAAAALGISEAALRMRLLRARAALRERLEARLGESLERLHPSLSFAPGVMTAIVSSSAAKTGGGTAIGTTLLATLGKVLPFKVASLLVFLASAIPNLGVYWWFGRITTREDEQKYQDPKGFRAQWYRDFSRACLWALVAILLFLSVVRRTLGFQFAGGFIIAISLLGLLRMLRLLQINRGRYFVRLFLFVSISFISVCVIVGALLSAILGDFFNLMLSGWWFDAMFLLMAITGLRAWDAKPMRMDYNLFLREQQGMLKGDEDQADTGGAGERFTARQLLAFARFLGERFLVNQFRWAESGDGLLLRLPPVKPLILNCVNPSFLFPNLSLFSSYAWKRASWIYLKGDGTVSAHCGEGDERTLQKLPGPAKLKCAEMEQRVAASAAGAWRSFRIGNLPQAERIIGDVPDAEIFHSPPASSKKVFVKKWAFRAFLLCLFSAILSLLWTVTHLSTVFLVHGLKEQANGDHDRAIADYTRALKYDPENAFAYRFRAMSRSAKGDNNGAIADDTQALKLDPPNSQLYLDRGILKLNTDDDAGAIADFTHVLQHDPTEPSPGAYLDAAKTKLLKGDLPGSLTAYFYSLQSDPKILDSEATTFRIAAKIDQGDYAGAIADLDHRIALDPKNENAYERRGMVKNISGDFMGALADYNKALELNSDSVDSAHAYLFRQLLQLRMGITPSPDFAQTVAGWDDGWSKTLGQFVAGRLSETELLAAAAQDDPATVRNQQCQAYYFIAQLRLLKGDQAGARDSLQKSLATSRPLEGKPELIRFEKINDVWQLARAGLARLNAAAAQK